MLFLFFNFRINIYTDIISNKKKTIHVIGTVDSGFNYITINKRKCNIYDYIKIIKKSNIFYLFDILFITFYISIYNKMLSFLFSSFNFCNCSMTVSRTTVAFLPCCSITSLFLILTDFSFISCSPTIKMKLYFII